jgi:transcription initiation factor IIE alpha subunit
MAAKRQSRIEKLIAQVRESTRDTGFLCPSCGRRVTDFTYTEELGFVCKTCEYAARCSTEL